MTNGPERDGLIDQGQVARELEQQFRERDEFIWPERPEVTEYIGELDPDSKVREIYDGWLGQDIELSSAWVALPEGERLSQGVLDQRFVIGMHRYLLSEMIRKVELSEEGDRDERIEMAIKTLSEFVAVTDTTIPDFDAPMYLDFVDEVAAVLLREVE